MYVDVGLIGVVVNLVDLFNFARECERNKFNYKVGDFRKIDFLGRLLQKQGISKVIFVFTYIQFNLCPALWPNDISVWWHCADSKLFNGSIVFVN